MQLGNENSFQILNIILVGDLGILALLNCSQPGNLKNENDRINYTDCT